MLCLSKTTGYVVAAMSCLDGPNGHSVTVREVADSTNISRTYLSKIVKSLVEKGLVKTKRGYTGGLLLTRPPEEISLMEIVEAVEGPEWIGDCLLGMDDCNLCPTREFWKEVSKLIRIELHTKKLNEWTRLNNGGYIRKVIIDNQNLKLVEAH
ncbi:MAG: Rrf2 family transcriptional regulator [Nitrospinaceae bacterium]|jgi:Rrf2 family transcriptional regulator, iron-sulfur cluster assembly transcription factor|nr:Rrf2 family transcriptional regulator [Nitrospinaceae bacterium]MBT3819818.1 Rrf2 family transcriptional regulator [Nitrospinaceae bacterium]MBT4094745.1 Rrf2 family transcriptional regulator [Nitrospinaceae bacterium]MBT4429854.1 Rrf2 family transcriptional regulator [Nitrospinaceae bacterium]MBT6396551.1 Rrf2 family transcriptional regulator [Nitrospinaceae bacterium]